MSFLGEPRESVSGRILRYAGYFLLGSLLGAMPAAWLVAATHAEHIAWRIPASIVLISGGVFCVLGIITRGRFLRVFLALLGKNIDSDF